MKQHPLITVGMPVYNRPSSLQRALDCIRGQTYRHLDIVVSDNASTTPQVAQVIANASLADSRIRHFVQECNIGPSGNFCFVLSQAKGSFFMWAADDDEWHPTFIEKLLAPLLKNPKSGLSFCDFVVRYPDGSLCNDYGSFALAYREFLQGTGVNRVTRYALQAPERGKANLIYGLFRREALVETSVDRFFNSKAWGADMLFVCDVISRWSFNLVDEKLYTVGIAAAATDSSDHGGCIEPRSRRPQRRQLIVSHLSYFFVYFRIMARTPDSNPISLMAFLLRLLPLILQCITLDLA
jgi:glycosyltransferase involved in cell wall biosynthesis